MTPESAPEWFESWFDTNYYHILYKNRDDSEAHFFIDNIYRHLHMNHTTEVMDLACGKGRHSIYLAEKGCKVTGVDLSENSIRHAQKNEHAHLKFFVKDMRNDLGNEQFDVILNLFTSFGYFENPSENIKVLTSVKNALKPKGYFILDYFNTESTIKELPKKEHKEIDGIHFEINKKIQSHKIVKQIIVNDLGHIDEYFEKVSAFTLSDFHVMFEKSGLELVSTMGDYALGPYHNDAERCVFILRKP